MILTRVEITNYKQYGGHHEIEIPQVGAIGVIGANGVGKTTLFEAIEWALYSPSSLKATDVKPRVWRGKTEVKVTLDDTSSGGRFVVERELGKGSAKARVYRVDQFGFEEKIVDGAPQVTAYVTDKLIGLDHAAFVATFFTRQKELGFFNGSPTTRRREVGKLLGLETIREAQQVIAEDRKRAQADARSYLAQSEAQSRNRDFPVEIAAVEESITVAKHALNAAIAASGTASEATSQAQKALGDIEQVREQDAALGQQVSNQTREHDVAQERANSATRDLERLDGLSAQRSQLEPVAAKREQLQNDASQHETTRQRALRKRELEQQIASLDRRDQETAASIREEISGAPAPDGNAAWNPETPVAAADWAASVNLTNLDEQCGIIATACEITEQLTGETKRLQSYHQRVNELKTQESQLNQAGDPQVRIRDVQNRLQELNGSDAAATATASRITEDLKKSKSLLANLHAQKEGETCPTCLRPFTSADTAHVISVFEREVQAQQQQLQQVQAQLQTNKSATATAREELQKLENVSQELTRIHASLETGNRYVQEQQSKVDELNSRLQEQLRKLNRSAPPTIEERDASQRELTAWRRVVDTGAKVGRAHRLRLQIATEREPIDKELLTLRDIQYDEARHREITEHLQQARQAQATIEHIDRDLARRDQLVAARETAQKIMAEARQQLAILQRDRAALGFDAAAYQQAQANVRVAQEQEKVATEQRHRADVGVREAENRLATIKSDQERIGQLALEAEAKQREADDLDLMYKEFTEFERFAAAWYAPRLSEIASDLVSQVTDGKYDRVEFDNNFSIQVYDGDDEKFPYETFSGGERDAIALCARIALSRVIGGASTSPPGFLVLDEVFGSLDLERRQRLLEMLSAITGADDHFRQVFIISHVDDVRTSPILDDIWQVSEKEDGTSELQPLGVGVDIGEL